LDEITAYRAAILDDAFQPQAGLWEQWILILATSLRPSFVYNIPKAPWASGWSKWIVNDWQLSSLWNFHTGNPSDQTRLNLDLIGDPHAGISHKFSGGVQWLNPAAFAAPAPGTVGNLARNKFYGPGYADVDFSVFKNFPITERVKIQFERRCTT